MGHQGLGTQHIPTDRTQHPHVEEFPGYSRVILKPGVQCAVVFVWVGRVLRRRVRGLAPLCRVRSWGACVMGGEALSLSSLEAESWLCWAAAAVNGRMAGAGVN